MIQVEISAGTLVPEKHEILIGEKIVKNLKAAGIPVEGFFTVRGVRRGQLMYETSGSIHKFTWREGESDSLANAVRSQLHDGSPVIKGGKHAEDDEL